jgi:hypothetical protein
MPSSYTPIAPSVADIKTQIETVVKEKERLVQKQKDERDAHAKKKDDATTALCKDVAKAKNDGEIKSHIEKHMQFLEGHAAEAARIAHVLASDEHELADAKAELKAVPDIDLT